MDIKESPMHSFICKTRYVLTIALLIVGVLWGILIVISNLLDAPIAHPAPQEYLVKGFSPETSLKICMFSPSENDTARLGVVIMKNGSEMILPIQESYRAHFQNKTFLPFTSSMELITAMDSAKPVIRSLLKMEKENNFHTPLYRERDVVLHSFIDQPAKMLHGTNSIAHHRNVKRITVKGWMPLTAKTILNPYNMITGDSFYAETNEEPEFGFFHGNNIDILTTKEELRLPTGIDKIDFETELAMVIGKRGSHISAAEAGSYVAGYLMFNDFSDRVAQDKERLKFQGYQKSKYINALGAWFLTDIDSEVFSVKALVNGIEVLTSSNDEIMEFLSVDEQIMNYSRYGTLVPGTVIAMGTMAGGCMNELELPHLIPGDTLELKGNLGFGSLITYIGK